MTTVALPDAGGGWRRIELRGPAGWARHPEPFRTRIALAAAHVAADPRADNSPGNPAAIDWDATLGFRRHLMAYGFGVAEAMDTAQRNMGLEWPAARELIARSAAQAGESGRRISAGAGTEHRPDADDPAAITRAYLEQIEFVESTGSQVIVMASRQLAGRARSEAEYRSVYDALLARVNEPVILHWLGEMFDPGLAGYWGHPDVASATDAFVRLVGDHAERIDGVKVSLLSMEHECELRARLPAAVRLYTGDDFNYLELIRGDGRHHSDALLGVFAAIAPAASAALACLDRGDLAGYERELAPTVALARTIFEPPTFNYKTGVAFVAWLCGHQPGFTMLAGMQSARSPVHLARVFELANAAGLFPDPDLAAQRMRTLLAVAGLIE